MTPDFVWNSLNVFAAYLLSFVEIVWFHCKLMSRLTEVAVIFRLLSDSVFLIIPTFQVYHKWPLAAYIAVVIHFTRIQPKHLTDFLMPHSFWLHFTANGPIKNNCVHAITLLCLLSQSAGNCCFYCSLLKAGV